MTASTIYIRHHKTEIWSFLSYKPGRSENAEVTMMVIAVHAPSFVSFNDIIMK
jgi:hypothetical protein